MILQLDCKRENTIFGRSRIGAFRRRRGAAEGAWRAQVAAHEQPKERSVYQISMRDYSKKQH